MRIKTLSYRDKTTGWELQPISFDQLTLLVGASGVGKTRILQSILNLKRIAKGASLNGVEWEINFLTTSGMLYRWIGSFEDKGFSTESIESIFPIDDDDDEKNKPKILSEFLYIDGSLIIDRNQDRIIFNGEKTVKLSKCESVISLLREEEQVKEANIEFDKIIFDDSSTIRSRFSFDEEIEEKRVKYNSLEEIRNSNEAIRLKLYFTCKNQQEAFGDIVRSFIGVFPYIEGVKVEPLAHNGRRIPLFFREMPLIQIKEKGIENWIPENRISSGMLRTIMHIAELYLCTDSSLVLIDEFENSLGVNCIDELANSIVTAERSLQFIITSHHPYIINNIHPASWKIITRKAGSVISHDGKDLNFDKSKHKAFTQLINLDIYSEGVES